MPVEYFPPAMNMARYFAGQGQWDVSLCTNDNHLGRTEFECSGMHIVRGAFPAGKRGMGRLLAYASFQLKAFFHLLSVRPDVVIYLESHSALPVFMLRLFNRKARLFIHYHEYHLPEDYSKPGMRMARWFHSLEKRWLYPAAKWISQTNEQRVSMFHKDHPKVDPSKIRVLANYPPGKWWGDQNAAWAEQIQHDQPIRFVYVGALSRVDTFIEEAVTWISTQGSETATLDIYSYNLHAETRSWLQKNSTGNIRFHEQGVPYDDLPKVLRNFHVGMILYKGNTPNYQHNASNKLFEYLACGLDVLYPQEMLGVTPFDSIDKKPRVIKCDFRNLAEFLLPIDGRQDLPSAAINFNCETELSRLEQAMVDIG